ncbi:MAG: hypothetical protein H7246_01225 [Phycisphaerae bacterium]|nr:hypothetical protein [Saprospiraceae bacterium]
MKPYLFVLVFFFSLNIGLWSQKDSTNSRPAWAAGLYGSISAGYGAFPNPFKHVSVAGASLPKTGGVLQFDAGIMFRNQIGLRLVMGAVSTNDIGAELGRSVAAKYPGYIVTYVPRSEGNNGMADHFSVGLTYSIPRQRWFFQPELLFGSTEIYTESAYAQIKELGTHRVIVHQLYPDYQDYRSPTLTFGGRAAWYAGRYFGFFADAHVLTMWYKVQYQVEKTTLIEQTVEKETIQLKKTSFGTTASVGIFLQIARWEGKGVRLKGGFR